MGQATITLGGRDFPLEPLKLGQLRALLDALDNLSGKTGGAVVDAAAQVILAALSRSTPELTLEGVLEFEATMDELTAAVAVILGVAGLNRPGDANAGEAKAPDGPPRALPGMAAMQPPTAAAPA